MNSAQTVNFHFSQYIFITLQSMLEGLGQLAIEIKAGDSRVEGNVAARKELVVYIPPFPVVEPILMDHCI